MQSTDQLTARLSMRQGHSEYQDVLNPAFIRSYIGGEDVPLFAVGSYAYLFSGVHEQNYIPIAMQFAGCFGRKPNGTHCAL